MPLGLAGLTFKEVLSNSAIWLRHAASGGRQATAKAYSGE